MQKATQLAKGKRSKRAAKPLSSSPFWKTKSIEQLMKEQGITPGAQLEKVLGAGNDLWDSDEEFEEFLNGIYARRKENLELELRRSVCTRMEETS